ncbi:MAG TPA: serine/threonine-protein kinase, partial [Herpetosiphonaceae bacterium]|nr:serine/threonine-protein kinase [Herpetosiphonaceae bacterium]
PSGRDVGATCGDMEPRDSWKDRYRLDPVPLGVGGYAEVFAAERRATNERVALKRVRDRDPDKLGRLRREIRYLSRLDHPHIMPVLDHGEDHTWYTMPVAERVLLDLAAERPLDDRLLAEIVRECAIGLRAGHAQGLVHRDVGPSNIMRIGHGGSPRWVVSDRGMVRNPPGYTTAGRTLDGRPYGTFGFAAPEMLGSAHRADLRADIYSLGRVVAWATLGDRFVPTLEQLPEGRWRDFVRITTQRDPRDRPQDMTAVLALLDAAFAEAEQTPLEQAVTLVAAVRSGQPDALDALLRLTLANPEDIRLYLEVAALPLQAVQEVVQGRPADVAQVIENNGRQLLDESFWNSNGRRLTSTLLDLVQTAAIFAEGAGNVGLLQDAASVLFAGDGKWQQFDRARKARPWLERLSGPAARVVARSLRHHPKAASWYLIDTWRPSAADSLIQDAFKNVKPDF